MAISNGIFYSQTQGIKLSTNNLNRVIVSTAGTTTITGTTSGLTLFNVVGTNGQLMSVTDSTSGPLMSVNNTIGLTIFQVNSNNSIVAGTPLSNTFVISGTSVGVGGITSPTNKFHISATTDPIRAVGVAFASDTDVLTIDNNGVIHKATVESVKGHYFLRNKTAGDAYDRLNVNESIFNPSNLSVITGHTFLIDTDADYYILGDLYNSGTTTVTGTLKVGGVIYNSGIIDGSGIIE